MQNTKTGDKGRVKPTSGEASISVRKVCPEDAFAIASLKVICWQTDYKGLMPQAALDGLDAQAETPHWKDWLSDPTSGLIALLLETDNTAVGYALAGPMRLGDRPDQEIEAEAEIYAIYVHPEHQRRGFGQRLLSGLVEQLIREEYRDCGLWMVGGNLKAEGFYNKFNAQETGKRVEIHDGRIVFREKGWRWDDLKQLQARLTLRAVS